MFLIFVFKRFSKFVKYLSSSYPDSITMPAHTQGDINNIINKRFVLLFIMKECNTILINIDLTSYLINEYDSFIFLKTQHVETSFSMYTVEAFLFKNKFGRYSYISDDRNFQ